MKLKELEEQWTRYDISTYTEFGGFGLSGEVEDDTEEVDVSANAGKDQDDEEESDDPLEDLQDALNLLGDCSEMFDEILDPRGHGCNGFSADLYFRLIGVSEEVSAYLNLYEDVKVEDGKPEVEEGV